MNWENECHMLEEYFWIMGLALMGMGIGFIYPNGIILLLAGLSITIIGIAINAKRPKH
jgi:hypothetical protein